MQFSESAISFDCGPDTLTGVLAVPEGPASHGVVVVVGGPQYRAGSHRQFVLLSRTLAAAGIAVLRFDYRGMGDSGGESRDFDDVTPDIGAAIAAIQSHLPSVSSVTLWGLCDGASAALLYCHATRDARVNGLCLLNPWVRSEASLARAYVKHYYARRLLRWAFWAKLFSGHVGAAALADIWRNMGLMRGGVPSRAEGKELPFQQRMALGWRGFHGGVLLLLSGADYTAKEFLEYAKLDPQWADLLTRADLERHDLIDADHTFSTNLLRIEVEHLTLRWLQRNAAKHSKRALQ